MSALHISVAPEEIANIGGFGITNSLFTSFIVMAILIALAIWAGSKSKDEIKSKIPALIEWMIEGFYNFFAGIAGNKVDRLFPILFTFFLFIIMGNWIGLIPGVGSIGVWELDHGKEVFIPILRGPNADLNTTFALALISVSFTQYLSIEALGLKGYLTKFFNIRNPIDFFVGILEAISEVSKILSFSFRLFGNIFAGEVLLVVMTFLVPLFIPIPFLALEVFVGFIQALVFTMLSLIFIVLATEKHHA
jgi:F-type H+-transporting ATPase subunit a